MIGEWAELKRRSSARGPKGELLSLLTGNESEAEVRQLIINLVLDCQYSQKCPVGEAHPGCPFRAMAGLSYHSMKDMAESMPLEDCLQLFQIEQACRALKSPCPPQGSQPEVIDPPAKPNPVARARI